MTRLSRIFVGYLAACLASSFVIAIFAFLVAIESEAPSLFKFLELVCVCNRAKNRFAVMPAKGKSVFDNRGKNNVGTNRQFLRRRH